MCTVGEDQHQPVRNGKHDRRIIHKGPPTFSPLSILHNPLNKRLSHNSSPEGFLYIKKQCEWHCCRLILTRDSSRFFVLHFKVNKKPTFCLLYPFYHVLSLLILQLWSLGGWSLSEPSKGEGGLQVSYHRICLPKLVKVGKLTAKVRLQALMSIRI